MRTHHHDQRRRPRAGFSLMEVLVVVAIIVVLMGVGGVVYLRYLDDAKIDRARIDVHNLSKVVDTYKVKHDDYPLTLKALAEPRPDGKPYLESSAALIDPWGNEYQYANPGTHHTTGKPDIWSTGPNPSDPNGIIGNWTAPK